MVSSGMLRRVALVRTDVSELFLRSVRRLLVAACVAPSSPNFVTLMKETPGAAEPSGLTRATRRHNPEDTIFIVTAVKTSNLTCSDTSLPYVKESDWSVECRMIVS
jgi:hypothetical protein